MLLRYRPALHQVHYLYVGISINPVLRSGVRRAHERVVNGCGTRGDYLAGAYPVAGDGYAVADPGRVDVKVVVVFLFEYVSYFVRERCVIGVRLRSYDAFDSV